MDTLTKIFESSVAHKTENRDKSEAPPTKSSTAIGKDSTACLSNIEGVGSQVTEHNSKPQEQNPDLIALTENLTPPHRQHAENPVTHHPKCDEYHAQILTSCKEADNQSEKEHEHNKQANDTEPLASKIHTQTKAPEGKQENHITEQESKGADKNTEIHSIEIGKIQPNPNQPRKQFPDFSILKLANSIQQFGIIQPLVVRKIGDVYELVAGERRLRAAKELNWTTVPCIISNNTEEESAQIAIIENLLREDLNIFEQAAAIEALIDTYNLTQEQVAKKLSASQSYIANKLRLLRLSKNEQETILENSLTERHARALIRIKDDNVRKNALDLVVGQCMNVQACEEFVESILTNETQNGDAKVESNRKRHEYKDNKAFYNAIIKALDCAKYSELPIKTRKFVGEEYTEITIIIPTASAD